MSIRKIAFALPGRRGRLYNCQKCQKLKQATHSKEHKKKNLKLMNLAKHLKSQKWGKYPLMEDRGMGNSRSGKFDLLKK